jgi:4-hydroxythreonine-4-phosphate dehydrogenase
LKTPVPRIVVTPGEPSGIGPDVVIALAATGWPAEIVAIADPDLLRERADILDVSVEISHFAETAQPAPSRPGVLQVAGESLTTRSVPGQPDPSNSAYVLETLRRACTGCLDGTFSAMVTGPVDKSLINRAGMPFSGHTEYLAGLTDTPQPVMLLIAGELRVALVTTHLALRDVPDSIDAPRLHEILIILDQGLRKLFGIDAPRITVLGLNPHAGESGYLGTEEQEIIEPTLRSLRSAGMQLIGPLPADTAFTPTHLADTDAVLAMYHDQGLPVLKHKGFGEAVNVTLGLPIIRTSVDHGTALSLAGTGHADPGSMLAAVRLAIEMRARTS